MIFFPHPGRTIANQELVDNMARYIALNYSIVDNFVNTWLTFDAELTLTNTGPDIPAGNNTAWSLYFSHSSLIEPDRIYPDGAELTGTGLKVYNVNGYLYRIVPIASFRGIPRNKGLKIPFQANGANVARTDVMPNWYMVAPNAQPRTIDSTSGNDLNFVGAYDTKRKYKRTVGDLYNPYTAIDRFTLFAYHGKSGAKRIIPTPVSENLDSIKTMKITGADWVVVVGNELLTSDGQHLAGKSIYVGDG